MAWLTGLPGKILKFTQGRATAFFMAFFVAGHLMAWFGKLTTVYVAYMGTLGGLVLGHSIKEDWAARNAPPAGGPDAPPAGDPNADNKS